MHKSFYQQKDKEKFKICNKLISRGVLGSSSYEYSKFKNANTGNYNENDIVGISVNGNRKNRLSVDYEELDLAIKARCTFITDKKFDRNRSYNIGEREVENYLLKNNYIEIEDGTWKYNFTKMGGTNE